MWHYMWAHVSYHLTKWFPRDDRIRIRIVLFLFSCGFLVPQLVILLDDQATRYCEPSLFSLLVASVCFTLFMIGFTVLFTTMEPIPWQIKLVFHAFGIGSAILGALYLAFIVQGTGTCVIPRESTTLCVSVFTIFLQKDSTPTLYFLSLTLAVFAGLSIVFFLVAVPFWIINHLLPNAVLDKRSKTGICYEPVRCCNCIWHV
eukprot:m.31775 g.31775  ORF g.31775 m.31775 type:complete len:202 (+) comp31542_c0_seq4:177-782(+)